MPDTHAETPATPTRKRRGPRLFVGLVAVVLAFGLMLPLTNMFIAPASGTPIGIAAVAHPAFTEAGLIIEQNCLDCHTDHVKMPFYANLPVAHGLIEADRQKGMRYIDMGVELTPADDEPYGEAALAKLEYALDKGSMPPGRYVMLHWDRALSSEETATIREAITEIREANYKTPTVAERFASNALQPIPESVPTDPARVALGEQLYHDVRLSGDDTISCATCHGLDMGGCDQVAVSTGIDGQKGPINSPTVYNAVFNKTQFWDGRAADLAEQAAGPVHNPLEMGASWEIVLPKLRQDAELVAAFDAAYDDGLTGDNVAHAIAEFEKTLITPDSDFDLYLKGDETALSAEALHGLELFRENACTNCHVGVALGGQSFEHMGRRADYFADRGDIQDVDFGRYNVTQAERDKHHFKVPVLRNVELTYPYFHDASADTLEEAVATMAKYQGYREFAAAEVTDVVAFLKSLTGKYQGEELQ